MTRLASFLERLRPLQATALLCLFGALVHVQSLFVGYLGDDFDLLHAATSPSYDVLRDAFPAGRGTYFRPLVIASLRLEHALVPSPLLHHVVNLVAHLGTGVLVYAIALQVARRSALAFGAALLFLVHPVTVFDASWISGRTDVFAALFALLSLHAFLRSGEPARSRRWTLVSVGALVLALSAKEVAAFTPIAAAALLWFERCREAAESKGRGRLLARTLGAQIVTTVAWSTSLYLRFHRSAEPYPGPSPSTLFKGLVAVPLGLVWPTSYRVFRHLMDAHPVASVAAGAVGLALTALVAAVVLRRSDRPLALVALGVFAAAPLLPMLGAGLTPLTRLLYVPLATMSIALAAALAEARVPRLLPMAAPVVLGAMALAAVLQGRQWVDNSRRMSAMCEDFKALRQDAPEKEVALLSTPYEIKEVPLFYFHQNAALGACLADHRSFEPMELFMVAPVVLDHSPDSPVVSIERRSTSDIALRASPGAMFAFDVTLDLETPVVTPELSVLGTEVRNEREVTGFVVSLAPHMLEDKDLLFFDGVSIRRVPSAPH